MWSIRCERGKIELELEVVSESNLWKHRERYWVIKLIVMCSFWVSAAWGKCLRLEVCYWGRDLIKSKNANLYCAKYLVAESLKNRHAIVNTLKSSKIVKILCLRLWKISMLTLTLFWSVESYYNKIFVKEI